MMNGCFDPRVNVTLTPYLPASCSAASRIGLGNADFMLVLDAPHSGGYRFKEIPLDACGLEGIGGELGKLAAHPR
jgi:hypothetical protein